MAFVSPVEKKFREAKDALNWLNNTANTAERGIRIDFSAVQHRVEPLVTQLTQIAQGITTSFEGDNSVGIPSSASPLNPALVPQNISTYSSMRSSGSSGGLQRVTELQKRKAETLATELRQLQDHLCRCHQRNEANAQLADRKRELLGDHFTGVQDRTNFAELDLHQQEQKSLEYLKRRFAHMEEESNEVLAALKNQGSRLSNSNSKVNSLMESLGLGDTVLGQIVKRNNADAAIVYVGIVLLLILMWKIWTWSR